MNEFHNTGSVPLRSSAYVARRFEEEIAREVNRGEWVLLLGPRQHGKTTGLTRLKRQFRENKYIVAAADLQGLRPCQSYSELLQAIAKKLCQSLEPTLKPVEVGHTDDFVDVLNMIFEPAPYPIVIIVDEAGNIRNDDFRNSFYGQIREIANSRADSIEHSIARRLRFIFSGTFRWETLVEKKNSPFNITKTVYTDDLTVDQARELAANVAGELVPYVGAIFAQVGGQPYLLQTAFIEVLERRDEVALDSAVSSAMENFPHVVSLHLQGIFSQVIESSSLSAMARDLLSNGTIRVLPADSDSQFLRVIGLADREGINLHFRNEFYKRIASESPQLSSSVITPTVATQIFEISKSGLDFMKDARLQEVCYSFCKAGAVLYRAGCYRMALTAFGAAMESLLIDYLSSVPPSDLAAAVTEAKTQGEPLSFDRFKVATSPDTWNLANLIKGAKYLRHVAKNLEPNDALRDWRNLIHPKLAMKDAYDEAKLLPEVVIASGSFTMLSRNIKDVI